MHISTNSTDTHRYNRAIHSGERTVELIVNDGRRINSLLEVESVSIQGKKKVTKRYLIDVVKVGYYTHNWLLV